MSLKFRDANGVETPVAGLNGTSGELVPSVSYYQSGNKTSDTTSWSTGETGTFSVDLSENMPDADYVVVPTLNVVGVSAIVHAKTVNNFKVTVRNDRVETINQAITLYWQAFKLMTDESRALDEAAIADNSDRITALETLASDVIPNGASSSNKLATVKGSVDRLMPQAPWIEDNFNNAKIDDTGVAEFTVLDSAANTPATGANYVVIYTGFSATLGRQVAVQNGNTATYTRSRTGADTWSAWQELSPTSTVASGSTAPITSGGVYSALQLGDFVDETKTDANACIPSSGRVGHYYLTPSAANLPIAQYCFIMTQMNGATNRLTQILTVEYYDGSERSLMYFRSAEYTVGGWLYSPWQKVAVTTA